MYCTTCFNIHIDPHFAQSAYLCVSVWLIINRDKQRYFPYNAFNRLAFVTQTRVYSAEETRILFVKQSRAWKGKQLSQTHLRNTRCTNHGPCKIITVFNHLRDSDMNDILQIWCDFDRASSLICGNKMPTRCNRGFYCRSYCLLNKPDT